MIDDTPEETDFSRIEARQRAAISLLPSIGWKLIAHDIRQRIAGVEKLLLTVEEMPKRQRAALLAVRNELQEVLALPETILAHKPAPITP